MTAISVLALGGTIDNHRPSTPETGSLPGSQVERLVQELVVAELLPPGVTVQRWGRRSGATMTPSDFVAVADAVTALIDEGADGVVVTTGTDTLEECAYALACLVRCPVPVVVTGCMRRPGEPGSDAAASLLAAVRAAGSPELVDDAPVVVLGDEVLSSVVARKSEAAIPAAFGSENTGRIGVVAEGRFLSSRPHPAAHHLGRPSGVLVDVDLVWMASGSDGVALHAAALAGRGVVVAALGGGHLPPAAMPGVEAVLTRNLPVVVASRCGLGPTLDGTYAGPGSELHLQELGAVMAGFLSPLKARLRLLYGWSLGLSADELFPVGPAGLLRTHPASNGALHPVSTTVGAG